MGPEPGIDGLQKRLDTESKAPRLAVAKANPIDEFRDRQAYRDVLRTARNAASLDDLHDSEGNKLVRLNFQATVLPPKDGKYARSYGLVDFEVDDAYLTLEDQKRLYVLWLQRLNRDYSDQEGPPEFQRLELDDVVDAFILTKFKNSATDGQAISYNPRYFRKNENISSGSVSDNDKRIIFSPFYRPEKASPRVPLSRMVDYLNSNRMNFVDLDDNELDQARLCTYSDFEKFNSADTNLENRSA